MASLSLVALSIIIFHLPLRALSSASGTLAFFLDEDCETASHINPSTNLPTNTCLLTPGALGIAVKTLPPCESGDASLVMYTDTSCAREHPFAWASANCWFNGPDGVQAVMFACKDTSGGSSATATSTVSAGSSSMPVAGGAAATPAPDGTSGQNASPSSNAATTSPAASSPSSTASAPGSSSASSSVKSGTGAGLSHAGQIILSVVLPVAGVVIAFLAWRFPVAMMRRGGATERNRDVMLRAPSHHSTTTAQVPTPPATAWPPYGDGIYQQLSQASFGSFGNGGNLSGVSVAGQGYGQGLC